MPPPKLDAFTQGYVECALWSSTGDDGDESLGRIYDIKDIATAALKAMARDCKAFRRENAQALEGIADSRAGHDFWLTRNGHGTGFQDRDIEAAAKLFLCAASRKAGEVDLYVGDDRKIHISNERASKPVKIGGSVRRRVGGVTLPTLDEIAHDVALEIKALGPVTPEDEDSDPEAQNIVDIRLQVYDNGGWVLHTGSSDYDQDHRGYWGSSSITPCANVQQAAKDVARELLDQVSDALAESGGSVTSNAAPKRRSRGPSRPAKLGKKSNLLKNRLPTMRCVACGADPFETGQLTLTKKGKIACCKICAKAFDKGYFGRS